MARGVSLWPGGVLALSPNLSGDFPGAPSLPWGSLRGHGAVLLQSPVITGAGGGLQLTVPAPSLGPFGGELGAVYPSTIPPAGSSPFACTGRPMGRCPIPAEAMGPEWDSSFWSSPAAQGHPTQPSPPTPQLCATASTPAHPWPVARFGWHVAPLAGLQLGSCVHKQPGMDPRLASVPPLEGQPLPAWGGGGRGQGRAWPRAEHAAMPAGKTDTARASPVGAVPLIRTTGDRSCSTQTLVLG